MSPGQYFLLIERSWVCESVLMPACCLPSRGPGQESPRHLHQLLRHYDQRAVPFESAYILKYASTCDVFGRKKVPNARCLASFVYPSFFPAGLDAHPEARQGATCFPTAESLLTPTSALCFWTYPWLCPQLAPPRPIRNNRSIVSSPPRWHLGARSPQSVTDAQDRACVFQARRGAQEGPGFRISRPFAWKRRATPYHVGRTSFRLQQVGPHRCEYRRVECGIGTRHRSPTVLHTQTRGPSSRNRSSEFGSLSLTTPLSTMLGATLEPTVSSRSSLEGRCRKILARPQSSELSEPFRW